MPLHSGLAVEGRGSIGDATRLSATAAHNTIANHGVFMSSSPTTPVRPSGSRSLVSVIIPTVDRPKLLDAALGSVAAQEMQADVEVVVVNDGGPSVAAVVRAWNDVLPVTLVELDRRAGPATARNVGIERADGKYIAFLDDDDLFMPDHLAIGCGPLERDEADFVYLGAVVADRRLSELPTDLTECPLKAYPYDHRLLLVANYLHTGSVIVRNFRNTTVRFDESLVVCEDWDLWLTLTIALGYRVSFVNRLTTIYHQVPDASGLVAEAQTTSPSKFELARDRINAKWRSADPLVLAYRDWMVALEQFRSDLIAHHRRMPNLLFDSILAYLHDRLTHEKPPEYADISRFFPPE
jgi:glycosyltransferase involved in cell wall biosynthesis